jgi:hypothetical protein
MGNLYYLYLVSAFSALVPLTVGIYNARRLKFEIKLLVILFAIAIMVEGSAFYLFRHNANANWILHFYVPIEYIFIIVVFSFWQTNLKFTKMLRISIPFFLALAIYDIFDSKRLLLFDNLTPSVACVLYVGIASYTLISIERSDHGLLLGDYRFWFASGLLIFSAGSLAYFAFFPAFDSYAIWAIFLILNISSYLIYTVGIICQVRRQP